MSVIQPPRPAKLVIGLFMKDRNLLSPIAEKLIRLYGSLDMVSHWFAFDFTNYYAPEMGDPLYRRMLTFGPLIEQDALPDIKLTVTEIEKEYAENGMRAVNIDPGFMVPERFVLATGKNFTHRIYIGKGVYADLTLIFTRGKFQTLPWTYPDYADQRMIDHLMQIRQRYEHDLKQLENKETQH